MDSHTRIISSDQLKTNDKAVVVTLTVHTLGALDPLHSEFSACVNIKLRWLEPKASKMWTDGTKFSATRSHVDLPLDDSGLVSTDDSIHIPALVVENLVAPGREYRPSLQIRQADHPGTIRWERKFLGAYRDVFIVKAFPFDVQRPKIVIRLNSQYDKEHGRFFAHLNEQEEMPVIKPGVTMAEWHVYKKLLGQIGEDEKHKPMYTCSVVLRRKHEYFTFNIMLTYGVICSMGLSVFNFQPDEFEQRSTLLLTVIFTAIAFKFLVTQELPRVPYSTSLDWYLNAGVFLLALLFGESTAVVHVLEGQQAHVDAIFAKTIIGLWAAYNSWYVLRTKLYLRKVARELGPPGVAKASRHLGQSAR